MARSLSESSGGTMDHEGGPLNMASSVALPEMDIPLEYVFRNMFNQQQTK